MTTDRSATPRVVIIGGGLSGLAAAAILGQRGLRVELLEARRELGGRAGSFRDPASGELVDHCQHVGMACCTNWIDFCQRTDIWQDFRRYKVLHFFAPDGRDFPLRGRRWLPAPLHLAPWLLRLGYLTWHERMSVARCLMRLARPSSLDGSPAETIGAWLRRQGQSEQAMRRFWAVVLVSALGERLDRASLGAARKVFVDGFLSSRHAYYVDIPNVPLGVLYSQRVAQWLQRRGVNIRTQCPVTQLEFADRRICAVHTAQGNSLPCDFAIVALPWRRVGQIIPQTVARDLLWLERVDRIQSAPITAVHLWFDRPITALPHAVLVDRLSQWLFSRGSRATPEGGQQAFYYQVVISASYALAQRTRDEVLQEVVRDLTTICPDADRAALRDWRIVTQPDAVFSVHPQFEDLRPPQRTELPHLFLAGDWTRTGWPATMESAVRSGYLAAEALLEDIGQQERILVDDLPPALLPSWLGMRRASGFYS